MDCSDQTPLHSAVKSNDLETFKILLRKGMDIHAKNEKGLTVLHTLVQQRLDMLRVMQDTSKECQKAGRIQLSKNEKMVNLLFENDITGYDCADILGFTQFHVACTLQDSSIAECLSDRVADIDQGICQNSPIYPGYTALHFASLCNIDTVKILVSKGADLLVQDARGTTALDICIESFGLEELHSVLNLVAAWRKITFSDRKTKLLDYVYSLGHPARHSAILQNISRASLPKSSPLWPGGTILHVAVTLLSDTDAQMVSDVLASCPELVVERDSRGSSAVHLAFRRNKIRLVKLLIRHHRKIENAVDADDLSHLHITVAVQNLAATRKLLGMGANVNAIYRGDKSMPSVKPGWTPLHVAVAVNDVVATRTLLENGADLLQTDARGFTAVHLLLAGARNDKVAEILLGSDRLRERVVEDLGLTHLHVAVWLNNVKAIERLLDHGSDLEALVGEVEDERLSKLKGCRAIQLAMMNRARPATFEVLLRRGADVLAGESPALLDALSGKYDLRYLKPIVDLVWSCERLRKRIEQEMGMTMLHLACYALDRGKVQVLLGKGFDVDARIKEDSRVWPGFTPLHALVLAGLRVGQPRNFSNPAQKVIDLMSLLLSKKANVTIADVDGETPVQMTLEANSRENGYKRAALLLEHQRDFSVNPVNKSGMSHFHAACLTKNLRAVKKLFKHADNVDVNRSIAASVNGKFTGYTPLLMALTFHPRAKQQEDTELQVQVVDLLLERGANVRAIDSSGHSVLHKLAACTYARKDLLGKILIDNANVNRRANDGKTPMEILLTDGAPSDEIKYLIKKGARINSHNPMSDVGYMAIVLASQKYKSSQESQAILGMMMASADIAGLEAGRNAIHNAVTVKRTKLMREDNYVQLFEKLMKLGCDIHQKDNLGRTALHLACKFENKEAIMALLTCGLDINDIDANGMSPPIYARECFGKNNWLCNHRELFLFVHRFLEVYQMLSLKLSDENLKLSDELLHIFRFNERADFDEAKLRHQVLDTKSMKIGRRGLTVYSFLHETKLLKSYSSLLKEECEALDHVMKSIDKPRYSEIWLLVKMQCRKALDRSHLLTSAVTVLRTLLGFNLPDVCADIVFKYLNNSDLRNLNKAMIKNDLDMIVV